MTGPERVAEARRVALQSTAELWRGLAVIDAALRLGRFTDARAAVTTLRGLVKIADAAVIEVCRAAPTQRLTVPRAEHTTALGCTVSVWPSSAASEVGLCGAFLTFDLDQRHAAEVLLSAADRDAIRELLR